jgi:hypothetical protein
MTALLDDFHHRRGGITISNFQLAIALSVLLHIAVLWQWKMQKPLPDDVSPPPLTVKLEPLPGPPPSVATPPQHRAPPVVPSPPVPAPPVARAPAPPQPAQPRRVPPPVAALPPMPGESAPPPMRAPPADDFATYVEAQRRARGEPAASAAAPAPAETENARATRLAVANLSMQRAQGAGYDPNRSGGIFTMKSRGVDYAEFMFNGWHADARRNMAQLVEVRKGDHGNIELAVVRKMIEIIRANVQGDFQWRSHRMDKVVTLSARQQDNAGLEEFLMREFFYNPRIAP